MLLSEPCGRGTVKYTYLIQPLPHQTPPANWLHDLKCKITLFRKTDLELEIAHLATKTSGRHCGRGEVKDLERADPKTEKAIHRFSVIGGDDAYFGDGAEEWC